jgi:hypothetical protein
MAMGGGAVATIAFFLFKVPASYAGAAAFAMAAAGMILGSLLVKRAPGHPSGRPQEAEIVS